MLKKIFQVQNIQIKSITGIIKDLSHANKLQSLQDFHFLSNSISQQPIKQHNSQINDPWSFFWSKTSCEFNISLNLRLFSKKKKKTFLCLALSSLVTLAFSFMVVRTKIRSERLREREKEGEEPGGQNGLFTRAFLSLPLSLVGALINMRAERKKERKNGKKGKKERSKSHNRTEQSTTCSAPLPLDFFFILFIFIYLFIINWNFILFFFTFFVVVVVCFYFCLYFLWASACARVCRWGECLVLDGRFWSSARVEGWDLKWRGLH